MLSGTTAFVTGASQGIGRTIAVELADEGANVALAARSDGIHETAAEIGDDERTLPVETDVTDEESVAAAIEATVDEFGGLDCLVNNAGIAGPTAPVEEVDVEGFERTMDVNVTGAFRCVKHAAPHLRASDRGSVVTISSISGKRPLENRTPYAASKMAVIGLTRTLAFELGEDDVTVNAVCPGATRGPRIDDVIEAQADQRDLSYEEAKREVFTDDTALGRLTEPEDVARTVVYLASEDARNVTAQDVNVDAGTVWY
ncbi:SDR family NAD(P)-dependent oxidoreductase [Halorientalis regularis]|jgi:NAD(P)-dependent dehydrogenase (short-subunit alcohol dehydrogenase family)|uniref:NAD(P)-dependent dehydrogenase, short-chain alcohol dehydrogenase family n=1 Tax=Halorientalis regularis TaxID=660518 RepID=A0A1G7M8K9_9EURY|nr:SDR family oxidoreductase [Halorientalis regularis]SDF57559.1 NAD(P)-dependent dehydrogenase, short-chain alcohol dehydrogenase family [Halorientalis regularis]